jgi:hypothetical protein
MTFGRNDHILDSITSRKTLSRVHDINTAITVVFSIALMMSNVVTKCALQNFSNGVAGKTLGMYEIELQVCKRKICRYALYVHNDIVRQTNLYLTFFFGRISYNLTKKMSAKLKITYAPLRCTFFSLFTISIVFYLWYCALLLIIIITHVIFTHVRLITGTYSIRCRCNRSGVLRGR